MGKLMECWQLVLLFPCEKVSTMPVDRLKNFKNALIEDGLLDKSMLTHPDSLKLFKIWEEYINTEKENLKLYDEVKRTFISMFGEKNFYAYLDHSYYMHRTKWLNERNLTDTNYKEAYD
jgi:hypothetical protein